MTLLIQNPHRSIGEDSSIRHLNSHNKAIKPHYSSSPPPDLVDFSFPVPPSSNDNFAAAELFRHGRLLPSNTSLPPPATRVDHRRAESLDGCTLRPRGEVPKSEDCGRLRRASSDPRPTPATSARQKWPLFVLGPVRLPAEMEMKDIRSRQMRRGPPTLAEDTAKNGGRKSPWRTQLLRALSCKAAENSALAPASTICRF